MRSENSIAGTLFRCYVTTYIRKTPILCVRSHMFFFPGNIEKLKHSDVRLSPFFKVYIEKRTLLIPMNIIFLYPIYIKSPHSRRRYLTLKRCTYSRETRSIILTLPWFPPFTPGNFFTNSKFNSTAPTIKDGDRSEKKIPLLHLGSPKKFQTKSRERPVLRMNSCTDALI